MPDQTLKLALPARILDEDLRAAITQSRQFDIQGLELSAYTNTTRLPDLSLTGRRELRQLLAGQDRQLAAVHVDCGPKGLAPGADVDRILNAIDRALDVSRALGASVLTLDIGPLPEPARQAPSKPQITSEMAGLILLPDPASSLSKPVDSSSSPPPDPAFLSQIDAVLADLGRRADRYSLPIAFHSDLASYAAIDRALRAAACPWFGIDLDPASVLRDDWTLDEILSQLGSLLRHVRARDATRGSDRRTKPAPVGQGSVDWPALFPLLDQAGYHAWLTLDPTDLPDRLSAARAGLTFLQKIQKS